MTDSRKTLTIRLSPEELKDFKLALLNKDLTAQGYLHSCIIDLIKENEKNK